MIQINYRTTIKVSKHGVEEGEGDTAEERFSVILIL